MIQVQTQGYELVDINTVRPHPENPNVGALDAIAESMTANGFFGAILVQRSTQYILVGNHRWKTAKEQDLAQIPVIWLDVDDDRARRIMLADNRTARLGADDDALLAALLKSITGESGTLAGTGYGQDDFDAILERVARAAGSGRSDDEPAAGGDDFDPAPDETQTRVRPGDIWELGAHRLACGDSTSAELVGRLMQGELADIVVTDPPYGVAYVSKTAAALKIANDALGDEGTRNLVRDAMTVAPLREGGVFYVCSPAGDMETQFRLALIDAGLGLRQCIVWVKNHFVMGRQDYHWRHESILYGWRDGAAHYFIDDRTKDTVWEIERPARNAEHPTMKPITLIERALSNSSRQGDIVFDGFGGSGSTLIGAHRCGRRCRTIELDPTYAEVILRRYTAETGKEPVLLERIDGTAD